MIRIFLLFSLTFIFSPVKAEPISAEKFGRLPSIYDIAISPDGTKLAGFVNNSGTYAINVVRLDVKDAKPELVILEKGLKPKSLTWANSDYVFASVWQSNRFRGESTRYDGIFSIDTASVLNRSGKVSANRLPYSIVDYLRDDPDHILVNKSGKFGRSEVHKIPLKRTHKNLGVKIQDSIRGVQRWITDQRGEPRVGEGLADGRKGTWNMKIRDAGSDTWRDVSEYPGITADLNVLGFTNDVHEMVVVRYNDRDTLGVYIYDLTQKRFTKTVFHDEKYDVSKVLFNSTGKVIGVEYLSDSVRRVLFQVKINLSKSLMVSFRNSPLTT